jgi:hypothetical protein
VGSEYCLKAVPNNYLEIINKAKKKYALTLLLPPLLESEIDSALQLIDDIKESLRFPFEIVINDWGLLYELSKKRDEKISLVLGRMLSYQKRGNQKLYDIIKPEDLSYVPILDEKMIRFLKNLGIKRIEIDVPANGVVINKKIDINLSIYTPFSLLSYTLNCPFTFKANRWQRNCSRECLNSFLVYTGGDNLTDFFQCGKIYYTESNWLLDIADMIIYISWKKEDT